MSLALIAPLSGGAWAANAEPGCETAISADGGCCSETDTSDCSIACPVHPAAVGDTVERLKPLLGSLPFELATAHLRFVLRPPDTAPPKSFSA